MNHRRRRLDRRRRHLRWLRREYPRRVGRELGFQMLAGAVGLYIKRKMREPSYVRALLGLPQEPLPTPTVNPAPSRVSLWSLDIGTPVLPDSHPRERGKLWVRGAMEIRGHAIKTTFENQTKEETNA